MREFERERLVWIELAPERLTPTAPPLQKALAMLLLPEEQLPACCKPIGAEAAGTSLGAEIGDVIAAVLMSRFSSRTVAEICARVASPSTPSAAASPTARSLGWALRRASKKAARPKPPANSSAAAATSALAQQTQLTSIGQTGKEAWSKALPGAWHCRASLDRLPWFSTRPPKIHHGNIRNAWKSRQQRTLKNPTRI